MGYYSSVAIGMRNESAAAMMGEFKKAFPDSGLFDKGRFGCETKVGKVHTVFYWDEVKWYDETPGYEDIQWIMGYLRYWPKEETEPFYFVRIGQDLGDVQTDCNLAEIDNGEIGGACFYPISKIAFLGEFRELVEGV